MSCNRMEIDHELQSYFQIMQSMDSLYEEYARKNGLTYMSLYILETLYEQNGCTQKKISEVTLYPKQTVNMVIRSFMEKGWVELEQSEDDRRNKRVELTEAGRQFARKTVETFWSAGSNAFAELGAVERGIMIRTMRAFATSFSEKVRRL